MMVINITKRLLGLERQASAREHWLAHLCAPELLTEHELDIALSVWEREQPELFEEVYSAISEELEGGAA